MNIGFDGKRAAANFTGLGNYSRFIIEALSKTFPQNSYKIYAPKPKNNTELNAILNKYTTLLHPSSKLGKKLSSLWRISFITKQLKEDGVELFHGLSNELPIGIEHSGVKSIVSIHDLIFRRYPQYYKPIDRIIYNYKFSRACRVATRVIAISECTKRDIVDMYNINPNKIDVVYQGCNPIFSKPITPQEIEDIRNLYHLPKRYILNVGTIEPRKNLMLIAKALRYIEGDVSLVAIGRKTKYAKKVEGFCFKESLTDRVNILEGIPLKHLPAIYAGAEVFVYPSKFEGFGIPIIEALSCGTPVVAAKGSCLEEAGGDGALYIKPYNSYKAAQVISTVINDKTLRNQLVEQGQKHIQKFAPQTIANNTMEVYKKALEQ